MKPRISSFLCILIFLAIFSSRRISSPVTATPLACLEPYCFHFPMITKPVGPIYFPLITKYIPATESVLIINHENIDITRIPNDWLAAARNLTIHYAQTSHGTQILSGLEYLETYQGSAKYAYAVSNGGTPPSLPGGTDLLKIYIGNNYSGNTYITPDLYWDGIGGVSHTNSTAATGLFDYSMWSWCGQADTSDAGYINSYLIQMSAFETAFADMQFILMTGHNVGNPGTNLLARNQQIRNYASAHNMVLFDFADIETHDPDGNFYDPVSNNYSDGNCPWCSTWCASHTSYCDAQMLTIYCAHTHPLFCKMKAQAFWWMMARLAGWSGTP